jgi:hypothetical protein
VAGGAALGLSADAIFARLLRADRPPDQVPGNGQAGPPRTLAPT